MSPESNDPKSPQELREELSKEIDEAEWSWILPFAKRDQVILVSNRVNLLEAGIRVALDDKKAVSVWLNEKSLRRPEASEFEAWEKSPQKKFMILVIQPYVLAQEILLH